MNEWPDFSHQKSSKFAQQVGRVHQNLGRVNTPYCLGVLELDEKHLR